MTRSLARALAIAMPESKRTPRKRQARRIRGRRSTTRDEIRTIQTERRSRRILSTSDVNNSLTPYYCICRGPDIGTLMIMCDDPTCEIQWFHIACIDEDIFLDDEWICPHCRH